MHSAKNNEKKTYSKKEKKLIKLIKNSESEDEDSEHELSYYINDRIKLMKEVLKIIKPKKIKSMAPDCIKNLKIEEINSMLLEELLGISNKRLKYIFNGQNLNEDSSSTDPEEEQQPIDIISLDDISDDDFIIDVDSDKDFNSTSRKKLSKKKIKIEPKRKKMKKEKHEKTNVTNQHKSLDEQNLMTVLELLELQARARAIRSQLALENKNNPQNNKKEIPNDQNEIDNDDAIIIESPKNIEIVITSSESELEDVQVNKNSQSNAANAVNIKDVTNSSSDDISMNCLSDNKAISADENCGSTKQFLRNQEKQSTETININHENANSSSYIEEEKNCIELTGTSNTCSETKNEMKEKKTMPLNIEDMQKNQSACVTELLVNTNNVQSLDDGLKNINEVELVDKNWKKNELNDTVFNTAKYKHNLSSQLSGKEEKMIKTEKKCHKHKTSSDVKCDEAVHETKLENKYNFEPNSSDKVEVDKNNSTDYGDGIVINVDQSEMDSIISD